MLPNINQLETLKIILENNLQPQRLDTHPWTKSLIVMQACADMPELLDKTPGQQLIIAIARLFAQMMPATAPRQGKRLDTHWGEFGILAAQYFAPLIFGAASPASLREAWGRIDQSILLFVYGKSEDALSKAEKETYKLVGDELEVTPNSTLSDWNRNGLQRLLEMILRRERYLSESLSKPAVISYHDQTTENSPPALDQMNPKMRKLKLRTPGKRRFVFLLLGILLLGLMLVGGFKAWRIYNQAVLVRQDAAQIQDLITAPGTKLDRVKAVGPTLSVLKQDFETLKGEIEPFLWMGPWLNWLPVYGGDLASVQDLMIIADSLLASADISYQAISPLLGDNNPSSLNPIRLTEFLVQAQPQLIEAHRQIDLAVTARTHLTTESLSPEVRDLILKDVDPLITLVQDGLTVAVEFPRMMGATSEGPKTYLLLVQNEDELRPTGGFITSVGTMLVQDGRISSLTFEDSGDMEDWSKPYPAAPWQLQQYMNSRVLILRDINWFTNYPTAALYAESLYSYINNHSVDGVIALDQQMLVETLDVTGPIQLDGVSYPIDSSNVLAYMRSAKTPAWEERLVSGRVNKLFMKIIADILMEKIFNGDIQPERLFTYLMKVVNERHLLLQFDNPSITSLLTRHRWDGAVRTEEGDFLMVVDTNIGFNKTNVVVASNLSYDVDLTKPASPIGSLTVVHTNHATPVICKQWNKIRLPGEEFYPIADCYWNYLRVYMTRGAKLLDATPQSVPANWLILKQDIPARVDNLEEGIDGVQAFGTLQVIPGEESLVTSFRFALPADILTTQSGSNQFIYHLLVQKQPGTLAVPITIRVHLPSNASIQTVPAGAVIQDQSILYQTGLRTDLKFEIVFQLP
jgi:hypothetical protein